jgi:hypothetical protein
MSRNTLSFTEAVQAVVGLAIAVPVLMWFFGRESGDTELVKERQASPYPFAKTCQDMQDVYNEQYAKWYEEGRVKNKIEFSLFGESRFRLVDGNPTCSKGVATISGDTSDNTCVNTNMQYLVAKKKWDWGNAYNGSSQSCLGT